MWSPEEGNHEEVPVPTGLLSSLWEQLFPLLLHCIQPSCPSPKRETQWKVQGLKELLLQKSNFLPALSV